LFKYDYFHSEGTQYLKHLPLYSIVRETLRPSAEGLGWKCHLPPLSDRIKSHHLKRRFEMSEWYQVKAKGHQQKRACSAGHKVGDEFINRRYRTGRNVLLGILYTLPVVSGLQSGAHSPGRKTRTKPPSPARMRKTRSFFN